MFTEWDPTAKDDMAALRARFDTNGDGRLTAADADFGQFKVMVTGPDGAQTARTLSQLGISEITLKTDATLITHADGSQVTGQATFTMGGVKLTAGAGRQEGRTQPQERPARRCVQVWTSQNLTKSQGAVKLCSSNFNQTVYGTILMSG